MATFDLVVSNPPSTVIVTNDSETVVVVSTSLASQVALDVEVAARVAGDAALSTSKVSTTDPRLTDARTPTSHTHGVSDLTATGTKDTTTFLRGDNTWAAPAGGTVITPWQFNPNVGSTIAMMTGQTTTGAWGAAGHTNFFPLVVPSSFAKIDQFGFNCTTATAATTLTYGIYKVVGSNFERVLAGSADVSTTGMKMTTVTATQLDPGIYWIAVYFDNSGPAFTLALTPPLLGPIPHASSPGVQNGQVWGLRIQNTAPAATMACVSVNNGTAVASGIPLLYVRTSA